MELINEKLATTKQSKGKDSLEEEKYDESLIKKVNKLALNLSQQYSTESQSLIERKNCIFFKMLKCETKLIRFMFELNGLV